MQIMRGIGPRPSFAFLFSEPLLHLPLINLIQTLQIPILITKPSMKNLNIPDDPLPKFPILIKIQMLLRPRFLIDIISVRVGMGERTPT